jgi:hypothetical protein
MCTPLANERWGTATPPTDGMKKPEVTREGGAAGEEEAAEKPAESDEKKKSRDLGRLSQSKGLSKLRRRPDS